VDTYEWLLFLHVTFAFVLVAALVVFGVLLLGLRSGPPAIGRLSNLAFMLWNAGGLLVLVFGVWLALNVDRYDLFDGWIIGAIVLWGIASAAAGQLGAGFAKLEPARAEPAAAAAVGVAPARAGVLYAVMAVGTLLLLVDMIWKPGA
jgi:hypothetical protein